MKTMVFFDGFPSSETASILRCTRTFDTYDDAEHYAREMLNRTANAVSDKYWSEDGREVLWNIDRVNNSAEEYGIIDIRLHLDMYANDDEEIDEYIVAILREID